MANDPVTNYEYMSLWKIREMFMEGRIGGSSTFPAGNAGDLVTYTGIPGQYGTMGIDTELNSFSNTIPSSQAVWSALANISVNGSPITPVEYVFNVTPDQLVISGQDNAHYNGVNIDKTFLTFTNNIPTSNVIATYLNAYRYETLNSFNNIHNEMASNFNNIYNSINNVGNAVNSINVNNIYNAINNIDLSNVYNMINSINSNIYNAINNIDINLDMNNIANSIIPGGTANYVMVFSGTNGYIANSPVDRDSLTTSWNIASSYAVMNAINNGLNTINLSNFNFPIENIANSLINLNSFTNRMTNMTIPGGYSNEVVMYSGTNGSFNNRSIDMTNLTNSYNLPTSLAVMNAITESINNIDVTNLNLNIDPIPISNIQNIFNYVWNNSGNYSI